MASAISPERTRSVAAFIGREPELAELRAGLDDAIAGRGRLFLISGEPGIGKTRITNELATGATQRGARVIWGRCWEGTGAPAYWPWVQILTAIAEPDKSAILELGPELGQLISADPSNTL